MPAPVAKAARTLQVLMAESGVFRLRDLALKAGIQEGQIGQYSRGHVPTEEAPIKAIAKALGVKPSEVVDAIVESSRAQAERLAVKP